MDIQRGDQVYYRGEVWTVRMSPFYRDGQLMLSLEKPSPFAWNYLALVQASQVQRVEQAR